MCHRSTSFIQGVVARELVREKGMTLDDSTIRKALAKRGYRKASKWPSAKCPKRKRA